MGGGMSWVRHMLRGIWLLWSGNLILVLMVVSWLSTQENCAIALARLAKGEAVSAGVAASAEKEKEREREKTAMRQANSFSYCCVVCYAGALGQAARAQRH